jgi:drug/metabolite transporter superfamily protein YnfA
MWLAWLGYFFTGAVLVNGVPHFVKGITGARHMSPFGRDSSAVVNVLWGAANFVVGALLLRWIDSATEAAAILRIVALALGGVFVAVMLAWYWSRPGVLPDNK